MELYHTSPTPIEQILTDGTFGSFLFFSAKEYVMTANARHYTYRINIDEDQIIDAERIFYHENAGALTEIVVGFCTRYNVDQDIAEELIAQRASVYDELELEPEELAEASWDTQRFAARAAQILGYRGASMNDEQGRAYLIDMLGREAELNAETTEQNEK